MSRQINGCTSKKIDDQSYSCFLCFRDYDVYSSNFLLAYSYYGISRRCAYPCSYSYRFTRYGRGCSYQFIWTRMALSGDLVIQGATKLTASSANVSTGEILTYTALFSVIVGGVAIAIAFYSIRRDIKKGILKATKPEEAAVFNTSESEQETPSKETPKQGKHAKLFAILVPTVLLMVISTLMFRAIFDRDNVISGGDATGFMGGTALILLVLSTFGHEGSKGLEKIIDHLREGFYFAIKIFAPVIPIAGFFFLGNPDDAGEILGEGTPGFLFDWGQIIATSLG